MILKKVVGTLLLSAVVMLSADFKEGVNYKTLETPLKVEKGTVVKVWSFTCPFCYKYDKSVTEKVIKALDTKFEVWHLHTKGKYGQQGTNLMAVAQARDLATGKDVFDKSGYLKKLKFSYYKEYHKKKHRWDAGEDAFYKEGFKILGVNKAQFKKELATPEVQALLKRWKPSLPIAKIQGIPGFVVDGKYLLTTSKIKSRKYMIDLIKHLQSK